MVYVLDIGNTRIKGAVFKQNSMVEHQVFLVKELDKKVLSLVKKYTEIDQIWVSSVGKVDKSSFDFLSDIKKVVFVDNTFDFPFVNNYRTPKTVGIDRLVLAAGATLLFPNTNRIVIDAGTCVTYDFIDVRNQYYGGAISPGLKLRYESLHNYTAKLPLLDVNYPRQLIGDSTEESIHSGVVNGLIFEIEGFLNEIKSRYENFTIILTGGDAEFLAKRLKNTIFANSNFLIESLNQLYQYKINND